MKLGAFSLSLTVQDIEKSKAFYQLLGFEQYAGHMEQNWLIMKNGETLIGLFQGMFDKNMLTFNPGWDQNASNVEEFDDVRQIQKCLQAAGVNIETPVDESSEGPASFTVTDPDGNPILIDQHR